MATEQVRLVALVELCEQALSRGAVPELPAGASFLLVPYPAGGKPAPWVALDAEILHSLVSELLEFRGWLAIEQRRSVN